MATSENLPVEDVGPPQVHEAHDHALRKGTIGLFGIVFFVVAAAAPMAGLTGVLPIMVALGNGAGAAGAYVIVGVILLLFGVGYAAMSAHMTHAGAFMAYVGKGLGAMWGVGSAYVSVVAYNAVQLCVYGYFGAVVSSQLKADLGIDLPWYAWAVLALVVIQVLAVLRVDVGARVLGVLLTLEMLTLSITGVVVLLKGGGPEGLDLGASFSPSSVFSGAPGIAFAFAFASFIGFEATAIYGEESKDPKRTVPRATYLAIVAITVLFGVVSFGVISAYGASSVVDQAAQTTTVDGAPLANPAAFLFTAATNYVGSWMSTLMSWLLLTSLFAALLAFHNAAARYFYTMGRAGLLPSRLATTSHRFRTPVAASVTQSVLAVVVIALFRLLDLDPVLNLFYWGSSMAVISINIVQALVCLAVIKFFRDTGLDTNPWRTVVAPALGFVGILVGEYLLMSKFALISGTAAAGSDPTTQNWALNATGWTIVLLPFAVLVVGLLVGVSRQGKDTTKMVEEILS
jgi:amino acid transporter